MTLSEYVGQQVRRRRLAQGLSQRAVAEVVGTHRPNVRRAERGDHDLQLDTVRRLSEALGCTVADLVAGWESAHDA